MIKRNEKYKKSSLIIMWLDHGTCDVPLEPLCVSQFDFVIFGKDCPMNSVQIRILYGL